MMKRSVERMTVGGGFRLNQPDVGLVTGALASNVVVFCSVARGCFSCGAAGMAR